MHLLVAEDDRVTRELFARTIARMGCEATLVDDGGAAWEYLRLTEAPTLAILDWMMP